MAHLSIQAFGPLQVRLDGQPITTLAYDKVWALLLYVALAADRVHERAALAGLLWPDQPEATARTNLRQALARLRQAIGDQRATPPFLLVDPAHLQFNPASDYDFDAAAFTALLTACATHGHRHEQSCAACAERQAQAVALYQGRFLDKFALPDSDLFEEWVTLTREHLHRQALAQLAALALYQEARGDYTQALHYSHRQLELDPWREEAHRQTMRLLALTGQRGAALAQYERCRAVLAAELAVEPAAETNELYARIRNDTVPRASNADPLALPARRPHNLPHPPTPFVGRTAELATLAQRLADPACRLLTLLGPGGIGKTRLALQAATEQRDAFADGVAFVALAGVNSADALAPTIAVALNLSLGGHDDPEQHLLHALRGKELLLLLDNFEHLLPSNLPVVWASPCGRPTAGRPQGAVAFQAPTIGGSVAFLAELLAQAPGVMLLVTSRERLHLRGEWLFVVEGLQLPEAQPSAPLEAYSAVALFLQQARQQQADFILSDADRPAVARICQLVHGMPLALELAASWLRLLSCSEIAQEIANNLGFLAATHHDLPPRHRSLQAVFDHSWRLLTPDEQRIFAGCAAFRGGFTRDAATAVAGATLDHLAALVDKSLLRWLTGGATSGRYALHELTRQYAQGQLAKRGELTAVQDRHLAYFCELAETAETALQGAAQLAWLHQLDQDAENFQSALHWALQPQPTTVTRLLTGARLATALNFYWMLDVDWRKGRTWLQQVAQLLAEPRLELDADALSATTLLRAKAFYGAGVIAWNEAEYTVSEQSLATSAALWCTLPPTAANQTGSFRAQVYLASLYSLKGEAATAQARWQEALTYFRQAQEIWHLAETWVLLGDAETRAGNFAAARQAYSAAMDLLLPTGERWLCSLAEVQLGLVDLAQGRYAEAWPHIEQWLRLGQEFGLRHQVYVGLGFLAVIAYRQGDLPQAASLLHTALAVEQQQGVDILDHLDPADRVGIAALISEING